MILLKPPRDFDTFLYYQFCFLFCIAFLLMTFANGQSTLKYINPYSASGVLDTSFSPEEIFNISYQPSQDLGSIMKYQADLTRQNLKIPYINLFIYWFLMPLTNYIYLIWWFFFRKEDLNS